MDKVSRQKPSPKSEQNIVYGMRPVIEAIDAGRQIDRVLLRAGLQGDLLGELKGRLREAGIPSQYVPVEKLNALTRNNHQGVVAIVSPIEYRDFEPLVQSLLDAGKSPFVVLLDHVTDVRNVGAIARTAVCAGVDALVVPKHGSAQIGADAVKSSAGALMHLPVCREDNLKTVVNVAKALGMQVVVASEKASDSYAAVDYTQPTLLLMGSEDKGVSPELLRLADRHARIPIVGGVQSLNVSVAAALFMYEALRQRGE